MASHQWLHSNILLRAYQNPYQVLAILLQTLLSLLWDTILVANTLNELGLVC